MPERPLLILPSPGQPVVRTNKPRGGGPIRLPTHARQVERIEPKFLTLQRVFESQKTRLQVEAAGTAPEQVLVLETVGPIEDFIVAVQKIKGMEWLGEIEEDILPDDDFFALDTKGVRKPEKTLRGRAFLVFSNQQALDNMLSLWRKWQSGVHLPHGFSKWNQVFSHLRDIH